MSIDSERESEKGQEPEGNAPDAPAGSRPQAGVNFPVAKFRQGFFTDSRYGLLLALGEEPKDYQSRMESLLEDLQPRPGLESHLVEQIAETFWRMLRAQRMRDGLALKSIQRKVHGEEMLASIQASKAFDALEPFEHLKEALSRRGSGPTAAEIDEFVKTRNAFEKVRQGVHSRKKKKITNEPGMSMKTNKTKTKCLEKVGHLSLRFGHLRQTDTSYAENSGLATAICQLSFLFLRLFHA
jgi:hypothetical protein